MGFYWLLVNATKAGDAIEIVSPEGKRKSLVVLEAT
jgi:hypothetical protein